MNTNRFIALAALCAVATAPSLFASAEELAAALKQARNDTVITHNELVSNLKALDALVNQTDGDLRPAFDTFRTGLPVTKAAAERTSLQIATLKELLTKHFDTRQTEIQAITDPDMRSRALKRFEKSKEGIQKAAAALKDASTRFPALMNHLNDIEKALTYDLTAEGVKSVRTATESAISQYGQIREKIEVAVAELEKLTAEVNPPAK